MPGFVEGGMASAPGGGTVSATAAAALVRPSSIALLDMNAGKLAGYSTVAKFGRNDDVGTGAYEDIWVNGGTYNWLQAASAVRVKAGGNIADDSGGAGAQKVMIAGLDENWMQVEEEVTLAGASASSPTTTTFIRVYRAYVTDAGAYTGSNTAAIVIETTGDVTVASIGAGLGQTQLGIYTVPAGKTAYLVRVFINVSQVGNKQVNVRMWQRQNADDVTTPFASKRLVDIWDEVAGQVAVSHLSYPSFPAKTDVWFDAIADTAASAVDVRFDMILVDD